MNTELIFELSLEIGERQDLGVPAGGRRVIAPIIGGTFEGPKLKGTVVPGGADWTLTRPDGIREPHVRVTLKTDSGDLIYMRYRGIDNTGPDVAALDGAQVTAAGLVWMLKETTLKQIRKALRVNDAFQKVLDDPASAALLEQPSLQPLLAEAAD